MTPAATQLLLGVIEPALKVVGLWSDVAETLILGTAAHESGGFKLRRQLGGGPALGLFQIEPDTFRDVFKNFLDFRPPLAAKVLQLSRGDAHDPQQLVDNDLYSAAICRIVYYRAPAALPTDPNDIAAMGAYWDRYYNRNPEKGTVAEFVADYRRHVLGETP